MKKQADLALLDEDEDAGFQVKISQKDYEIL